MPRPGPTRRDPSPHVPSPRLQCLGGPWLGLLGLLVLGLQLAAPRVAPEAAKPVPPPEQATSESLPRALEKPNLYAASTFDYRTPIRRTRRFRLERRDRSSLLDVPVARRTLRDENVPPERSIPGEPSEPREQLLAPAPSRPALGSFTLATSLEGLGVEGLGATSPPAFGQRTSAARPLGQDRQAAPTPPNTVEPASPVPRAGDAETEPPSALREPVDVAPAPPPPSAGRPIEIAKRPIELTPSLTPPATPAAPPAPGVGPAAPQPLRPEVPKEAPAVPAIARPQPGAPPTAPAAEPVPQAAPPAQQTVQRPTPQPQQAAPAAPPAPSGPPETPAPSRVAGKGGEGPPVLVLENVHEVEQLTVAEAARDVVVGSRGRLGGSGQLGGALRNGGVLSPGHSPGFLHVAGDLLQEEAGELVIELGGPDRDDYDRILVEGIATLSGVVRIERIDGFVPEAGDRFDVLEAAAIDAEDAEFVLPEALDGVALGILVSEVGERRLLQIVAFAAPSAAQSPSASVPEPSPGALVAAALLLSGAAGVRRRGRAGPADHADQAAVVEHVRDDA